MRFQCRLMRCQASAMAKIWMSFWCDDFVDRAMMRHLEGVWSVEFNLDATIGDPEGILLRKSFLWGHRGLDALAMMAGAR